jgi:hypothetical protein
MIAGAGGNKEQETRLSSAYLSARRKFASPYHNTGRPVIRGSNTNWLEISLEERKQPASSTVIDSLIFSALSKHWHKNIRGKWRLGLV